MVQSGLCRKIRLEKMYMYTILFSKKIKKDIHTI